MNNIRIVAIIPARGGSKGVYRKNIKIVKGKPLIVYTIEAAKKSKLLDLIFVSTEDQEISDIVRKYNVEVIPRPSELAQDDTLDLPVFKHAVEYLEEKGIKPKIIVILRPTSPLRKVEDINNSIKILLNTKSDSIRSFCEVHEHPFWMYRIINDNPTPFCPKHTVKQYPRRQLLPKLHGLNGSVDFEIEELYRISKKRI